VRAIVGLILRRRPRRRLWLVVRAGAVEPGYQHVAFAQSRRELRRAVLRELCWAPLQIGDELLVTRVVLVREPGRWVGAAEYDSESEVPPPSIEVRS